MAGNVPATAEAHVSDLAPDVLASLVTNGDARKLTDEQRVAYYKTRCEAAGLDYRTQPLQYINLQGKLVLYALKAATDQLASLHGIRCEITDQRTEHELRIVTVRAIAKDGRQTDEIGAVPIKGLQGEALANAMMKAVTKAKRRAVLSVCGLGLLDETEVDSIPGVKPGRSTVDPPVLRSPRVVAAATHAGVGKGEDETREATSEPEIGAAGDSPAAPVSPLVLESQLSPDATMTADEWKAIKQVAAKHHITAGALRLWLAESHGLRFNQPTELPVRYVEGLRLRAEGRIEDADKAIQQASDDAVPF